MEENPDKVLTFPVELLHSPYLDDLTSAGMGCYVRIVLNYWLTGYPIPESSSKLQARSKANRTVWNLVKDSVMKALRVTMPRIIKERKKRKESYASRLRTNHAGYEALSRWNEAKKKERAKPLSDSKDNCGPTEPVKEAPYRNSQSDYHELVRLKQRLKQTKPISGGLRDK